jgi:hypothetical protein
MSEIILKNNETEPEISSSVKKPAEKDSASLPKETAEKPVKKTKELDNKSDLTEKQAEEDNILKNPVANPIWLSVSEAAKIGGVNTKTIRRAIQQEKVKYKIYKDRYLIGLRSLIQFLNTSTKLKNKLNFNGIGQYIKEWRK